MRTKIPAAVYVVSSILLVYIILANVNAPLAVTGLIFAISPFLLVWMVIAVLKSKDPGIKELEKGEEWGYADKKKEDLEMF